MSTFFLRPARMALAAERILIQFITGVLELLAAMRQLLELRAISLRQDDMTRIAVVPLDHARPVSGFVIAIVASKTAGPIFMPNIIGVRAPARFHLWKEVIFVDFLHRLDGGADLRRFRILAR